jgi:hypothetical protein
MLFDEYEINSIFINKALDFLFVTLHLLFEWICLFQIWKVLEHLHCITSKCKKQYYKALCSLPKLQSVKISNFIQRINYSISILLCLLNDSLIAGDNKFSFIIFTCSKNFYVKAFKFWILGEIIENNTRCSKNFKMIKVLRHVAFVISNHNYY